MIYVAAYLYVAGMPVAIHLADEIGVKMKPKDRATVAAVWPLLLPVYVYGLLAGVWGKA